MFENYGFVLNWYDLPEELQNEKIDAYITFGYNNQEYTNAEGENDRSLDDLLEDVAVRNSAESYISSHFPMYF